MGAGREVEYVTSAYWPSLENRSAFHLSPLPHTQHLLSVSSKALPQSRELRPCPQPCRQLWLLQESLVLLFVSSVAERSLYPSILEADGVEIAEEPRMYSGLPAGKGQFQKQDSQTIDFFFFFN